MHHRTEVAIIGAGPCGLLLGALLQKMGIDAMLIERRSEEHVLSRIRAGVLEQGTCALLRHVGVGERLDREGLKHDGFLLGYQGEALRIDLHELTGGRHVTVYGQTEVTRDLMAHRASLGLPTVYNADDVALDGVDTEAPVVRFTKGGIEHSVSAAIIAGCDGFHGVCRSSIPADKIRLFERVYPFGWLGLLADVPPCADELVYASHADGFALCSMRSPSRSRYYIQCPANEDVTQWTEARFFEALRQRLAPEHAARVVEGPALEMSVAPLRSFVAEPLNHGRLCLAGDAAHIVPPTGAKGLNLAAGDAFYLAEAAEACLRKGDQSALSRYSQRALDRIWKTERFSWWMTSLLHRFDHHTPFETRMQEAEFRFLRESRAARMALAENYVGLPL